MNVTIYLFLFLVTAKCIKKSLFCCIAENGETWQKPKGHCSLPDFNLLRRGKGQDDKEPNVGQQREEDGDKEYWKITDLPDLSRRNAADAQSNYHHVVEHSRSNDEICTKFIILKTITYDADNCQKYLKTADQEKPILVSSCHPKQGLKNT